MYAAEVAGEPLIFQVAGVYRRNMIIRDFQTGTLWQHATGEALMGPLEGTALEPLGGELTHWSKWKETYPHTSLAVEPVPDNDRYPGLIPRHRLEHLLDKFTTNFAAPGLVTDRRLAMHEEIVGISLDGVDKAYPLSVLRSKGLIHDRIGKNNIIIVYDPDNDHASVFSSQITAEKSIGLVISNGILSSSDGSMRWKWSGAPISSDTPPLEKLRGERQWWLGWVEFHPESQIYKEVA